LKFLIKTIFVTTLLLPCNYLVTTYLPTLCNYVTTFFVSHVRKNFKCFKFEIFGEYLFHYTCIEFRWLQTATFQHQKGVVTRWLQGSYKVVTPPHFPAPKGGSYKNNEIILLPALKEIFV